MALDRFSPPALTWCHPTVLCISSAVFCTILFLFFTSWCENYFLHPFWKVLLFPALCPQSVLVADHSPSPRFWNSEYWVKEYIDYVCHCSLSLWLFFLLFAVLYPQVLLLFLWLSYAIWNKEKILFCFVFSYSSHMACCTKEPLLPLPILSLTLTVKTSLTCFSRGRIHEGTSGMTDHHGVWYVFRLLEGQEGDRVPGL